jgi:hypothetical protein
MASFTVNAGARTRNRAWLAALGAAVPPLVFFLPGNILIRYAGIQTDEALFAGPLCRSWRFFSARIGQSDIPIMNMPYNGALKTWLYAPILLHTRYPIVALVRKPAVFFGAVTVLVFWALLRRLHSRRAAWIGSILLATDTSFVLTTSFDWGPVVLQHLLLVGILFLSLHWFQTNRSGSLAGAAFCCGLAFWDKAEFIWMFSGLSTGLLVIAPLLRRRLKLRHTAIVAAFLLLGALPLIFYNLRGSPRFGTLGSNSHLATDLRSPDLLQKLRVLRATFNGSALFGHLVNEDWAPQPRSPRAELERMSFGLHHLAGDRRSNVMLAALCVAVLLLPVLWHTRARAPMCFSIVCGASAWLFMCFTGGGGAAHHAVLLWPLPHLFIAMAFAEAAARSRPGQWALTAAVALVAMSSILVTNQYFYQFIRNGASEYWTDAIFPAAERLRQANASRVVLPDWGMFDSLCVLTGDKPPARLADASFFAGASSAAQRQDDLQTLSDGKAVWLEHARGHEATPGINKTIFNAARAAGFKPVMLETYYDRNGRAMFQSFRFARQDRGADRR